MSLKFLNKIQLSAVALALLTVATSCSVPQNLAETSNTSDIGNRFAPKTVAPEAGVGVSEAETVRQSIKIKVETANRIGNNAIAAAPITDDGKVYNVLSTVNIRSCPSTSCQVLRVARPGADVQNDPSGGTQQGNGYTWIRVTYGYASTNSCETKRYQGWMIVNPLAAGSAHITRGPLNVRSSPCNGSVIQTYAPGTRLNFHTDSNQYTGKWYRVNASATQVGWIDGWDFADVY